MQDLKIYTDDIEQEAIDQIDLLLKQEPFKDCKVRIMPDVHAGKGCVIGFTADLGDKVIPNIVGVDIGCGMFVVELGQRDIDLARFDEIVNTYIPSGRNIREHKLTSFPKIQHLHCLRALKESSKFERGIGTLGGGNHFIELDIDNDGNKYLVIHSGSRNMGKQVAEYYQNLAIELCSGKEEYYDKRDEIIKTYKEQGRRNEIQQTLKELEKQYKDMQPDLPKELCYLTGKYRDMYLEDMKICQEYAEENREMIAKEILLKYFNIRDGYQLRFYRTDGNYWYTCDVVDYPFHCWQTIHNYIDFSDNIVRKGAISAYNGEKVIIPMNMRDGSLICKGKGNPDWNCSAPHGAGRLMSRTKAKEMFNIEQFKESMSGIYSTSIVAETIDEAPFVYKPMQEIIDNIQDTAEVISVIKPIYNFKAKN